MSRTLLPVSILFAICCSLLISPFAQAGVDVTPSHKQTAILKVSEPSESKVALHTFCLDGQGRILAGCGTQPNGEIRVLSQNGKILAKWSLPITPEAVGVSPDGHVFVAGSGKVLKLDSNGKIIQQAAAPHLAEMMKNRQALEAEIKAQHARRFRSATAQLQAMENYLKQFEELNRELTDQEKQVIASIEQQMERYRAMAEKEKDNKVPGITKDELDRRVEAMVASKSRTSSVSATKSDVFLTCRMVRGYGFEVWRMNHELGEAKQIVSNLRGCCGQMDVQASNGEIFVAENARYRVSRYDRDGKEIKHFGKSDRNKAAGAFGSCCNPMNVCFGADGSVFAAESSVGRIQRFSPEGELLGVVGTVKLVPGCKNVAIAANEDGSRVFMLDITRSHIVVMEGKPLYEPKSSEPVSMIVMDPLSKQLACDCVEGYAQRDYKKLVAFLSEQLDREVKLTFAESLQVAMKKDKNLQADIIIGKDSVVVADAEVAKIAVERIAQLTGKDGKTTQTGLIVVLADSVAKDVKGLKGYRILFGPAEHEEKAAAAETLLKKNGIAIPATMETAANCTDGATKLIDMGVSVPAAAVISSYAKPLLEGCGAIAKGELRVVGETKPVPFITAFASADLSADERAAIADALVAVKRDAELCKAMETKGFVKVDQPQTTAAAKAE